VSGETHQRNRKDSRDAARELGMPAGWAAAQGRRFTLALEDLNFHEAAGVLRQARRDVEARREAIRDWERLPLSELDLDERICEALDREGIYTAGTAAAFPESYYRSLANFGTKYLEQLRCAIAAAKGRAERLNPTVEDDHE